MNNNFILLENLLKGPIKTKNGKGYLKSKIINDNLIEVSYVYKRKMDKKCRCSSLSIRRVLKLNKKNIYRIALLVSEGSHLSKGKPKTNYFKFTNTDKQIFKEGLNFLKYFMPNHKIKFELRYPENINKEDSIFQWSNFLKENKADFSCSANERSSLVSCSAYINKVFLPFIINKISWACLRRISNDKNLLTSWFAGRIDGDGAIHPNKCRIDIAYHKTDEAKLLRAEKRLLEFLNVGFVKDKKSNKKQVIVLQICGLNNIIKLFDRHMCFKSQRKINSLFEKTEFYLQFKKRFRKYLSCYNRNQIEKRNWNRYLGGSRRIPFSSLNIIFNKRIPTEEIESLRYGTKIITDKKIIKQLFDKKFMEVNNCVWHNGI